MKLITAIIRPERLSDVKSALFRVGVTGLSVHGIRGHGGEPEIIEYVRGQRIVVDFTEKVALRIAVSEPFVEPTITAILTAARTGNVGDGKIFVQPLERVIRIRTGEENEAALTPLTADEVQARALQEASGQTASGQTTSGKTTDHSER